MVIIGAADKRIRETRGSKSSRRDMAEISRREVGRGGRGGRGRGGRRSDWSQGRRRRMSEAWSNRRKRRKMRRTSENREACRSRRRATEGARTGEGEAEWSDDRRSIRKRRREVGEEKRTRRRKLLLIIRGNQRGGRGGLDRDFDGRDWAGRRETGSGEVIGSVGGDAESGTMRSMRTGRRRRKRVRDGDDRAGARARATDDRRLGIMRAVGGWGGRRQGRRR